ncbi:hypothetical protein ACIPPJ_21065 [Streptomyces sp. NPDC086091]|uniref:hypothetical protein n=1 Tax=Streptomyces sp. NPDC086091 TaxID=3365751 RepID=UPI00381E2627
MTLVTCSRPYRRAVRAAATTAVLAGSLLLTACSGGGGDDDGGSGSGSAPLASGGGTSSAETGGGTGGDTGGSGSAPASGDLEGSWLATADGKAVALVVTGKQAALFVTGGTVCSGSAGDEADMTMIRLKCAGANNDKAPRTVGMVDSVDGKTLQVTWEGGAGKETYTKAEGGQWPSDLPTVGLGS